MTDASLVREWHRAFLPFVCGGCRMQTTYDVHVPGEEGRFLLDVGLELARHPLLRLRCDRCGAVTPFPRARIDHLDEIREAVRRADALHLPVHVCGPCGGRGLVDLPPSRRWPNGGTAAPCQRCLGAGFLWSASAGAPGRTYVDLLAG